MTEDDLMLEARKTALELIGRSGSEREATIIALCKRMQAEGLREAADVANTMASYEVRNWCLFQAKEREG